MSNQSTSTSYSLRYFLGSVGLFAVFGFLALILAGFGGHKTIEEQSFEGEFGAQVTEVRKANLAEVSAAQAKLVNQAKVDAALGALQKSAPKAEKTGVIVPGSPTFMKQMEAEAAKQAAADAAKKAAEEKPAPKAAPKAAPEKPKAPAPAPEKPKAPAPAEAAPKK